MFKIDNNDRWDSVKPPARPQIISCDIQINMLPGYVASIYMYNIQISYDSKLKSDLDLNLSRSNPMAHMIFHDWVLVFKGNTWLDSAPLREIILQRVNNVEFDLSRSLEVKCAGAIGLTIYAFLLMFKHYGITLYTRYKA